MALNLPEELKWLKFWLGRNNEFYWRLMCHFPLILSDDVPKYAYGCTDGVNVAIGDLASTLDPRQRLLGLVGHEYAHCILHHTEPAPRVKRPDLYRAAQEIEAEQNIPYGFMKIGDLLTKKAEAFEKKNLRTCASIYLYLLDHPEEADGIIPREVIIYGKVSPEQVAAGVLAAATNLEGRGQGDMPYGIRIAIDALRKPRIDWRSELSQYYGTKVGNYDIAIGKFSSTWLPHGLYVPPLARAEGAPDVVIGVDTSGSMLGDPLRAVLSEVQGLHGITSDIPVWLFDAAMQAEFKFDELDAERINWLKENLKGAGGTSFVPFFELIEKRQLAPQLAMVFTDAFGTFPEKPPPYPVLWVTTSEGKVPFGDVLRIPEEEFADVKEAA